MCKGQHLIRTPSCCKLCCTTMYLSIFSHNYTLAEALATFPSLSCASSITKACHIHFHKVNRMSRKQKHQYRFLNPGIYVSFDQFLLNYWDFVVKWLNKKFITMFVGSQQSLAEKKRHTSKRALPALLQSRHAMKLWLVLEACISWHLWEDVKIVCVHKALQAFPRKIHVHLLQQQQTATERCLIQNQQIKPFPICLPGT